MSHFTEIKVEFDQKYEKQLIASLEKLFGKDKVKIHDSPVELLSYYGEVASKTDLGHTEKCHIVIPQKTLSEKAGRSLATNDAGFARQSDGKYRVFIDEAGFPVDLQGLLAQEYTLLVSEKELQNEGFVTSRVEKEDGTIRLEARIFE